MTEARKRTNGSREEIVHLLAEACFQHERISNSFANISLVHLRHARFYDVDGAEINSVANFEADSEVFISLTGEDFKRSSTTILELVVNKVTCVYLELDDPESLGGVSQEIVSYLDDDNEVENSSMTTMLTEQPEMKSASAWEVEAGLPEGLVVEEVKKEEEDRWKMVNAAFRARGVKPDAYFLKFDDQKKKSNGEENEVDEPTEASSRSTTLLYPSIVSGMKQSCAGSDGPPPPNRRQWPSDPQSWCVNKRGVIFPASFPQLCFTMSEDQPIARKVTPDVMDFKGQFSEVDYFEDEVEEEGEGEEAEEKKKKKRDERKRERTIHGWAVTLRDKRDSATNLFQQWRFTSDGAVRSKADPDQILTFLGDGGAKNNESKNNGNKANVPRNDAVDSLGGEHFFLATFPHPFLGRDARLQRWAWQQEALENFGQWRHNAIFNRAWRKKRLTWPADESGEMAEKGFDWPIKGFLVNGVPKLTQGSCKSVGGEREDGEEKRLVATKDENDLPSRLYVLVNGANPEVDKAVAFVPEDGARLWKELVKAKENEESGKKTSKYVVIRQAAEKSRLRNHVVFDKKPHRHDASSSSLSVVNIDVNCRKCRQDVDTRSKLQFRLLLEASTRWLNMPTRVKRIFKVDGEEVFDVKQLSKGDVILASTGKDWIDGRRSGGGAGAINNEDAATADVKDRVQYLVDKMERLKTFQKIRDCDDLVLEVEGGVLAPGAKLVINACCLSEEERDILATPPEYDDQESGGERT